MAIRAPDGANKVYEKTRVTGDSRDTLDNTESDSGDKCPFVFLALFPFVFLTLSLLDFLLAT